MTRAFLSFGSNVGDRLGSLRSAVAALEVSLDLSVVAASKVYETEPVEVGEGHPDYLNCAVEVECGLPALELLRFCQGIEAALGRDRKGEMAPRTIDIDILLFGGEAFSTPTLKVPHRGVERAFNLKSLHDLDPDLQIPDLGPVQSLLKGADLDGVRETGESVPVGGGEGSREKSRGKHH